MVAAIITMAGLLIAGTSAAADWPVDSFQVVAREPDIPEVQKPSGQGVGEGAEGKYRVFSSLQVINRQHWDR